MPLFKIGAEGLAMTGSTSPVSTLKQSYTYSLPPPPPSPPPPSGSSSGGSTTTTKSTTSTTSTPPPQPSTGLSKIIEQAVASLNTPPPMPTTPPTVPIIPAFGEHFVGWKPWELIQQWGTNPQLQWILDLLRQQFELRQQMLEQMAKEGLPVTPIPIITQQETKRPIGLRIHYIPM